MSRVVVPSFSVRLLTEKKPNYLKALSNIVNKLPKQVQVTELPAVSTRRPAETRSRSQLADTSLQLTSIHVKSLFFFFFFLFFVFLLLLLLLLVQLLSLLLEALSCPDQGVQLSTLSCLHPVLADPPPALVQQLEALVSRLLALTTSPAMVSETPNGWNSTFFMTSL